MLVNLRHKGLGMLIKALLQKKPRCISYHVSEKQYLKLSGKDEILHGNKVKQINTYRYLHSRWISMAMMRFLLFLLQSIYKHWFLLKNGNKNLFKTLH